MDKVHVYIWLHNASTKTLKPLLSKRLGFFNPFLVSTSWFLNLAEAFRDDKVNVCSFVFRGATEKKLLGGYATFPCSSKKK